MSSLLSGPLNESQMGELMTLRLRSMRRTFDVLGWAGRVQGFSPAEIEIACFDALRGAVLSDDGLLTESVFSAAVARMRARRAATCHRPIPDALTTAATLVDVTSDV